MPGYQPVRAAGGQAFPQSQIQPRPVGLLGPPTDPGPRLGGLLAPSLAPDELADLRRRQAQFQQIRGELDRQNSWLPIGALAPVAVVAGLEGGAMLLSRFAAPQLPRVILNLTGREPPLRVGDNWATRAGRRAHEALRRRLEQKPGWEYEPKVNAKDGGQHRPDVGAPKRDPADPNKRFQMEYKPNTPTGRRAGARQAKRYRDQTDNRTRVIFYDPKDYM